MALPKKMGMELEFEWLWPAFLLPLPVLLRVLLPPMQGSNRAALRTPFLEDFRRIPSDGRGLALPMIPPLFWLALLAWVLLICATMQPHLLGEPRHIPPSGRDLMLAIDLSGSMEQQDFLLAGKPVNRLQATKVVADDFISRRVGDRVGLILFGERAYLQAPLTFDRKTVLKFLDEAVIGLAGQKTAIGDAIGLAVKRLRERDKGNRILILMTDGANTAGAVDPLAAAEFAKQNGLKIYTIGIGADEQIRQSWFGTRKINPSSELDEKTLRAISQQTDGRYFRARNTSELQQIYQLLDELEPVAEEAFQFRPRQAVFYWPLAIALLLGMFIVWRGHAGVALRGGAG